jgi:hypothetical protein
MLRYLNWYYLDYGPGYKSLRMDLPQLGVRHHVNRQGVSQRTCAAFVSSSLRGDLFFFVAESSRCQMPHAHSS